MAVVVVREELLNYDMSSSRFYFIAYVRHILIMQSEVSVSRRDGNGGDVADMFHVKQPRTNDISRWRSQANCFLWVGEDAAELVWRYPKLLLNIKPTSRWDGRRKKHVYRWKLFHGKHKYFSAALCQHTDEGAGFFYFIVAHIFISIKSHFASR